MSEIFPSGVVIFFRVLNPDNTMARSVHPTGRGVVCGSQFDAHPDDYVVVNALDRPLGWYPRDFVSAILPLENYRTRRRC